MSCWKIAGLAAAVSFCAGFAYAAEPPAAMRGIGVLGDSYSDEYRFYTPDRAIARNWVEFLADVRGLNFGSPSETSRGAPRHQGFAYNWAQSAATTDSLIAEGQHTGIAAQVAAGEIDIVVVFIGGNDFINASRRGDAVAELERTAVRAQANLRIIVDTVLKARSNVRMVLLTIPDLRGLPEVRDTLKAVSNPTAVSNACISALTSYNEQIRGIASSHPQIALVDFDRVDRVARMLAPSRVTVGNRAIDRERAGNQPDCLILADRRHLGTVGQGLLARLIVEKINLRFQAGVKPISDDEILDFATRVWNDSSNTQTLSASSRATASP
jgi:phospholipase/lecithinase/hemolysin